MYSGFRPLDMLILLQVRDSDLINIFSMNKYFAGFSEYNLFWQNKIINTFGVGRLKEYMGTNFKDYYKELSKNASCFDVPYDDYWNKNFTRYFTDKEYKFRRGDIMKINGSKLIFIGSRWSYLQDTIGNDDWIPSIPQSLYVLSENNGTKLPLDYWRTALCTNHIVWLNTKHFKFEKVKYLDFPESNIGIDILYFVPTDLAGLKGEKYTLLYSAKYEDDDDKLSNRKMLDHVLEFSKFIRIPLQLSDQDFSLDKCKDYISGKVLLTDAFSIHMSKCES